MKITVFGASGRIGGEVVRQALDAGHQVVAVVREAARFEFAHPNLALASVVDLTDPKALRPALKGSDAAISGVGPRSGKDGPVASTTTRVILAALEASGVKRFVAVSAVPVGPVPDGESFFNRRILLPLMLRLVPDTFADLAAMEDDIRHSNTQWTVVRPPRLVDRPLGNKYRIAIGANVPRGYSASRADTAHVMLAALSDPAMVDQAVGIAY